MRDEANTTTTAPALWEVLTTLRSGFAAHDDLPGEALTTESLTFTSLAAALEYAREEILWESCEEARVYNPDGTVNTVLAGTFA